MPGGLDEVPGTGHVDPVRDVSGVLPVEPGEDPADRGEVAFRWLAGALGEQTTAPFGHR
jgi:hypothetical protein